MIYTKTGDDGTTSLVGGARVMKCDLRVEAYGTVDELNAHIGLMAEWVKKQDSTTYSQLKEIQHHLFVVQTLLATEDPTLYAQLPQLPDTALTQIEQQIDGISHALPKLNSFVMPGGNANGAQCHVARCVCRRAERRAVALSQQEPIEPKILQYLNRLSDYLFVLSRKLTLYDSAESYFSVR